jgi:excisionase family DNA binding protein
MKILTVKQVAELIQVKPSTIYAWAEQRRIPSIKINGLLRFIEAEILEWLCAFTNNNLPCYNRGIQARSPKKGGIR